MPRPIHAEMTLDSVEEEILFTIAALAADPDSCDLVGLTDGWLAMLEAARASERAARRATIEAEAMRALAAGRLDAACEALGDDLDRQLLGDRSAPRYQRFFSAGAAAPTGMSLPKKIAKVRSWLLSTDPVLERHRASLDARSKAALRALERTHENATARGELFAARERLGEELSRERLGEELSREREGLSAVLARRARERGLSGRWAELFFRAHGGAVVAVAEGPVDGAPVLA